MASVRNAEMRESHVHARARSAETISRDAAPFSSNVPRSKESVGVGLKLISTRTIGHRREHHFNLYPQWRNIADGGIVNLRPVHLVVIVNDDVAHSEAMDTLLRLVRRSADAFWQLVDEKRMANELAPSQPVGPSMAVGTRITNVVFMADFRNTNFQTSKTISYSPPVDQKWK